MNWTDFEKAVNEAIDEIAEFCKRPGHRAGRGWRFQRLEAMRARCRVLIWRWQVSEVKEAYDAVDGKQPSFDELLTRIKSDMATAAAASRRAEAGLTQLSVMLGSEIIFLHERVNKLIEAGRLLNQEAIEMVGIDPENV